jgi:hypothetical protein
MKNRTHHQRHLLRCDLEKTPSWPTSPGRLPRMELATLREGDTVLLDESPIRITGLIENPAGKPEVWAWLVTS